MDFKGTINQGEDMQERKRTVAYSLPPATIEAVKTEAEMQRRSASTVVGMFLDGWMKKQKESSNGKD